MADDSQHVGQDEIEQLLKKAQSTPPPAAPPTAAAAPPPPADSATLGQDEIEALLSQGAKSKPKPDSASSTADAEAILRGSMPPAPTPSAPAAPRRQPSGESSVAQADLDFLLNQAEQALASINSPVGSAESAGATPFRLSDFAGAPPSTDSATLDLIRDVELDLKIELGRTHMYLEEVLKLGKGAVVPLDKLAGDPVDIYVNGRLIARGEVLILNDNFCVRVAELVAGEHSATA